MDDLKEYVNDQLDSIDPDDFDTDKLKQMFNYIEAFCEDNYLI